MKPMKLTDVGPEAAVQYITSPDWIMQQKMDGARMMVIYRDDTFLFTNDGVKPIAFSAAKLRLPALEASLRLDVEALGITEMVLDGELIIEDGIYHAFDLLSLRQIYEPVVTGDEPWHVRDAALRRLSLESAVVQFSPTARTHPEKAEMWKAINDTGVEGAVSKHVNSIYVGGTRTKEWVKHKLVKTADVTVTDVSRVFDHKGMVTHGSAELSVPIRQEEDPQPYRNVKDKRLTGQEYRGLSLTKMATFAHRPRTMLPVGNASLIGKELTIEVGSVVEVNYLFWTGDAMIQPRIVCHRNDKTAAECDLDQFPAYTRKLAWKGR